MICPKHFFSRNSVTKVSLVARIDKTVFVLIELRKGNEIVRSYLFKKVGRKSIPGGSDSVVRTVKTVFVLNWVKKGECYFRTMFFKKCSHESIPGGSIDTIFVLNWVKEGECNLQIILFMKLIFRAPTINYDKSMSCWHTV